MTLIDALIVCQQEYGAYGDWMAIHTNAGRQKQTRDVLCIRS